MPVREFDIIMVFSIITKNKQLLADISLDIGSETESTPVYKI